jgi:hypothetical protein
MTDDNKEIPMPTKAEEKPVAELVNLTINDIHYCKKIIEIAVEKGTGIFKADELAIVGSTYNKISQWLVENQPKEDNTESKETSKDQQGEEKND